MTQENAVTSENHNVVVGFDFSELSERAMREALEFAARHPPTVLHVVRPADFVGGRKVPPVEPPLAPGQPHLKEFAHRHTYHSGDQSEQYTGRIMPVT